MNKLIFDSILKRIEKKETKLIVSSLTYYAILAIIPTIILSVVILKNFNLASYMKYENIIQKLSLNFFSNTLVSIVTLYMIARAFYLLIKNKYSFIKSLLFSSLFAILFIFFLTSFLYVFSIKSIVVNTILKFVLIFAFLFIVIHFLSSSKLRYSFIISLLFSLVLNVFIFIFSVATTFFIDYENYYGILAPVFILILAMNLFIYIVVIAYICAEEFTFFSNIKILKG